MCKIFAPRVVLRVRLCKIYLRPRREPSGSTPRISYKIFLFINPRECGNSKKYKSATEGRAFVLRYKCTQKLAKSKIYILKGYLLISRYMPTFKETPENDPLRKIDMDTNPIKTEQELDAWFKVEQPKPDTHQNENEEVRKEEILNSLQEKAEPAKPEEKILSNKKITTLDNTPRGKLLRSISEKVFFSLVETICSKC